MNSLTNFMEKWHSSTSHTYATEGTGEKISHNSFLNKEMAIFN